MLELAEVAGEQGEAQCEGRVEGVDMVGSQEV
jgi:hypothetical protein